MKVAHHVNHIGTKALLAQFHKDLVIWPGMQAFIETFTRSCEICARKGAKKTTEAIHSVVADFAGQHFYIDLTFMIRDGRFMGMCNMIDHLTKRLWSKPITSKESIHVKAFLIDVFEQIGLEVLEEGEDPMYLRSDNGGEFIAHCIVETCALYGIVKKQGPAYTPRCQGVIERPNKTIKDMINCRLLELDIQHWTTEHSSVIDAYNYRNKHSTIGMTPMEAWNACYVLKESDLTEEQALKRLYTIKLIRDRTIARGEADAVRKIRGKRVAKFHKDDVVLIRVPMRFRSKEKFVWGRKAKFVSQQIVMGKILDKWRVEWMETGGFTKSEKPHTTTTYHISTSDMKLFSLGYDKYTEIAPDLQAPVTSEYTAEDYMNDDDDPSQDTCDQSQLDDILDNALQQLSSGDLDPTSAPDTLSGPFSGRLPIPNAAMVFFALLSAGAKGTSPLIKDNDPVDSVTLCAVPLAKTCDPTTATKRKRVQEQDISDDSDDSAVTLVISRKASRKAVTKRRRRNLTE